jgi:hypothetical protein
MRSLVVVSGMDTPDIVAVEVESSTVAKKSKRVAGIMPSESLPA